MCENKVAWREKPDKREEESETWQEEETSILADTGVKSEHTEENVERGDLREEVGAYSQKQRKSVSTHMAYTLKKPWAMR